MSVRYDTPYQKQRDKKHTKSIPFVENPIKFIFKENKK